MTGAPDKKIVLIVRPTRLDDLVTRSRRSSMWSIWAPTFPIT